MKRRLAVLALAGAMAVTSLTGCAGGLSDKDVVATVDGDEITADVANFYARFTQAQYETYYAGYLGEDMWSSEAEEGKTYEESVKDTVLEDLEDMYLLEDHMEEFEVEITEEDETSIKNAVAGFNEANGLDEKEKVSGSEKAVERLLTLFTIQAKMENAIKATADLEVSDEEAAQKKMQYVLFPFTTTDEEGNSVELTDDEKAELKKTAEAFATGAKTAADFASYATEQGQEAKDASFDGEETVTIPEELAKAADALEEGAITEVVESDNGYYVAKLVSLFDKDATETEKENIRSQRKQEKLDETLEKWRKDAKIEVNEKVWKKVDFNELSVTMKMEETEPYADEVQTDDVADAAGE